MTPIKERPRETKRSEHPDDRVQGRFVQGMFPVLSNEKVASDTYVVRFHAPQIARTTNPGQFVNIKVDQSYSPLLRRPFSVYDVDGDDVDIVFNVVGGGTAILSSKRPDEQLDVIGPLGRPFLADDDYSTAVIVAGGLGVAPFPFLTRFLKKEDKEIVTFLGSRTESMLVPQRLVNARLATVDGSAGFRGTVVELAERAFEEQPVDRPKFFGCGPNPMLRALARLVDRFKAPCEVSLECTMGCGFGICQGCPVELRNSGIRYSLVCKEGPVYSISSIIV